MSEEETVEISSDSGGGTSIENEKHDNEVIDKKEAIIIVNNTKQPETPLTNNIENTITKYQSDLSSERLYRIELETQMSENVIALEKKFKESEEKYNKLVERVNLMEKSYTKNIGTLRDELAKSNSVSNRLESDLLDLGNRYRNLLGINKKNAAKMREEEIVLPNDLNDLQFYTLQLREQLIEIQSAREHEVNNLKAENTFLEDNIKDLTRDREEFQSMLQIKENYEKCQHHIAHQQQIIKTLEVALTKERETTKILENKLMESRQKCINLQVELDNSETVQRDFVRLSQSLQIQLEKIRQAEQEVRWQFEDDVDNCNGCEVLFNKQRVKMHCLHCGKIFCGSCLSQSISSGPKGRKVRICQVCNTLLNRESAPYFSNDS
uniref:FYVE-type domain-containing protein n=1 Tax=Strongyloides stercoralis TaxID=6248 RepID=A0A0K0E9L6_STRER